MVRKLSPFWKPADADKSITVVKTDKNFQRGVHRGEPIWKISRGESYMFVLQEEAKEWSSLIEKNPELTTDKV